MSQPQTGYAYLKSQYFRLCGAVRKHFTGNGRDNSNAAAEAVIVGATVTGDKGIYFKASVEKLRAAYKALQPQTVEA